MKPYTTFYQLKKETNQLEMAKAILLNTEVFSHSELKKLEEKLEENNQAIEKIEKSFRGKGFFEKMATEIAHSYTQDEKFRKEIQGVINQDKFKLFVFDEFMVAFEDEVFVQRLFTLNLLNTMIARPAPLHTKVLSAKKMAHNIWSFFNDMENGEEFFTEIMQQLVNANKSFFPLIGLLDNNFKELISKNKQHTEMN